MKTNETSNPLGKTWDEIEQSRSIREQAITWFNSLLFVKKWELMVEHKKLIAGYPDRDVNSLTGSEIEKIWLQETSGVLATGGEKVLEILNSKPNQKQFVKFDENLFKAYIDKFSNDDKISMLIMLASEVKITNIGLSTLLNQISSYKTTK